MWFSAGIVLVSLVALIYPAALSQSPTTLALPGWTRTLFYLTWGAGASFALGGLWFCRFDFEGAGMILLGAGLLAYTVTIIGLASPPFGSLIFLLSLTGGSLHRGIHLANRAASIRVATAPIDDRRRG